MAVSRGVPIFIGVLGAVVAVLALVLQYYGFHQLLVLEIKNTLPLKEGSQYWDIWRKTPIPILMNFSIFEVTNGHDVIAGKTPIVKEVGPFVYEEIREKQNITFHNEDATVSYYQNIIFKFRRDLSCCDENHNVTIINAPLVMVAPLFQKVSGWHIAARTLAHMALNQFNATLFIQKQVGEILFKGYYEPMLAQLEIINRVKRLHDRKFGFLYPGAIEMLRLIISPVDKWAYDILIPHEKLLKEEKAGDLLFHGWDVKDFLRALELAIGANVSIPDHMIPPEVQNPSGKFSVFGARNNSNDGRYRVYTGASDIHKFTVIKEWKGHSSVDVWDNDTYCNMINGTDGTSFPPLVQKDTIIYSFLSDGCRSLYATYKNDVIVKGIPGYHFVAPAELLASPEENPANKCFFPPSGPNNRTLPSGALNMTMCRGGPVILTLPHFLNAAKELQEGIKGLNPDPEKHESFIDIEPTSGQPLQAAKRVQLNIDLRNFTDLNEFRNITNVVFPLLWISEGGGLDDTYATLVKHQIITPLAIMDAAGWVLLAIGAVLILVAFIVLKKCTRPAKV